MNEFYEQDEPVEQVVQAFEQGDKQLTSRGVTQTLNIYDWPDADFERFMDRVERS